MSNKPEKSFEERLVSLKRGCIILGVLQGISAISSIVSLSNGEGNIVATILSVLLFLMIYFIYKDTSERNPRGPLLEKIYGILMLIEGIIYCITIIGAIFGIIFIVLAIGIIKESEYFKNAIENNIQ